MTRCSRTSYGTFRGREILRDARGWCYAEPIGLRGDGDPVHGPRVIVRVPDPEGRGIAAAIDAIRAQVIYGGGE